MPAIFSTSLFSTRQGQLQRLAPGIYTDNVDAPIESVTRGHLNEICAVIMPGCIVSLSHKTENGQSGTDSFRSDPRAAAFAAFTSSAEARDRSFATVEGAAVVTGEGTSTSAGSPAPVPSGN
ncbi:hypothetical protein ACFPN2_21475 [Steroidobacter flavus]|uniref:Uncharacterized protein n=1 Tax=Steroidobacter flavus TaxID=1842136 RepID=A0ABV8SVR2_9GAMM